MGSDQLVLFHMEGFDILSDLLLGSHPLSLLSKEFRLAHLHIMESVFEIGDHAGEMFLLFLQFFRVEFLPLTGIQSAHKIQLAEVGREGGEETNLRSLSIPQQALLLLELLDLILVGGLGDQLIDITERALRRYLEPSVLLANAIAPNVQGRVIAKGRASRGSRVAIVHLGGWGDPALARLRRHGNPSGSAKRGSRAVRHGREIDRTDGTSRERAAIKIAGEWFVHGWCT